MILMKTSIFFTNFGKNGITESYVHSLTILESTQINQEPTVPEIKRLSVVVLTMKTFRSEIIGICKKMNINL